MTIALALLEMGLLVIGTFGTILVWFHPLLVDYLDLLTYIGQATVLALSCTISFYYNDLYDIRKVRTFTEYAAHLLQALGVCFIALAVFYSLFPDLQLGSGPLFSSLLFLVMLVLPIRGVFYLMMRRRAFSERVLVLGTSPLAFRIVTEMEDNPHLGYAVIGIVDDGGAIPLQTSAATQASILGSLNNLEELVRNIYPDLIVVALAERRGRLPVNELLEMRLRGIAVEDGIAIYERLTGKLAIESLTPSHLIFSQDLSRPRWQTALRRGVSLLVAAAGLLIAWPLMLIIALLIWIDSGGPILFIRERVGLNGRVFPLLKFRSMHPSEGITSVWIQDNVHRVTRVGKWLRKFRLDELPQFINILQGDVNIVGPRPHTAPKYRALAEKIPYYAIRYTVRPGITGWAQVKQGYAHNLVEEAEKVQYDLYYIKHMSVGIDLRILFDTVKIVLSGRGSATPSKHRSEAAMGRNAEFTPGQH
jgi:exopolysaccharide biosynthesis polyprenyl glycosylphosphotransferase